MGGEKFTGLEAGHLKALNDNEKQELFLYLDTLQDYELQSVIDTGILFHKSSAVNGTWFWRTVPLLARRLQRHEMQAWLAEGAMICRGSWECGLSFLRAAPEILNSVNNTVFLDWTQIGRVLVRYSNHDANWYFKNSDAVFGKLEVSEQEILTAWVLRILEHSWQAAVACFKSWPEITRYLQDDQKEQVLKSGLNLAVDFPDDAQAYFINLPLFLQKAGAGLVDKWVEAAFLMRGCRRGIAGAFFAAIPKLFPKIDRAEAAEKFTELALLGHRLVSLERGIAEEYFEQTPRVLKYIDWRDLEKWLRLVERVSGEFSGQGALDFVKNSPELISQLDIRELDQWVQQGLEAVKDDQKEAYFALRSQESRDNISKFRSGLSLEAVKKVLLLYCEGLTGEQVVIRNCSDLPGRIHGDDRLFGTLDTRRLYLPDVVKVFENDRDNLRFYRVMLMHLTAHRQFGSFALNSGEIRELAVNRYLGILFEYLEDNRVDYLAARENPGLARDMKELIDAELLTDYHRLPEGGILSFLKSYFPEKCLELSPVGSASFVTEEVRSKVDHYWDKVVRTGAGAKDSFILAKQLLKVLYNEGDYEKSVRQLKNFGYRGKLRFDLIYTAMKLDEEIDRDREGENPPNIVANGDEELEPFDEAVSIPDGPEDNLNNDFYVWLKKLLYKFYEDEQNPYRLIAYYDEWDRALNDYKKDWCKVREILLKPSTGIFVTRTLEEHYGMISTLKRYFGMLRPDRFQRYYRQEDGEDIDIDAVVDAMIEKRAGVSPSGGFYVRRDKRERDVAVAFLLDLSYSTEEVISHTGKTLLDVEMESVIVMAEALEVLGDKYGIYGFNSDGRDKINFYVVKDFDEPYSFEVKQRFGGLQSYGMTRLAAAIRHAMFKMEKVRAAIKILIILSDGRPFDFDYKSGTKEEFERFYAETDTRMSLREAKMKGVNPFCITVDTKGKEYLEYIFGNVSYIIIEDVHALPAKLTETYKNLTT